jgi:hypothetical protein
MIELNFAEKIFMGFNMHDIEITGITLDILISLCWQSDIGFDLVLSAFDYYKEFYQMNFRLEPLIIG